MLNYNKLTLLYMEKPASQNLLSAFYIFLLIAVIYLFWNFINVLFLALIMAGVFKLPTQVLQRRVGRNVGTLLALVLIFLLTVLPVSLLSSLLFVESLNFVSYIEGLSLNIQELQFAFWHWQFDLSQVLSSIQSNMENLSQFASSALISLSQVISDFSLKFVLFWYFLFYFLLDFDGILANVARFLPFKKALSRKLICETQTHLSQILKGSLLLSLLTFLCSLIFFALLGIPSKLILALLVGILSLIPSIGSILAFLLIAPLIYFSHGIMALLALVSFVILVDQLLINDYLRAKLVEDSLKMHPLITFLSFFCGVIVLGNMGIFYGPLTMIAINVLESERNQ